MYEIVQLMYSHLLSIYILGAIVNSLSIPYTNSLSLSLPQNLTENGDLNATANELGVWPRLPKFVTLNDHYSVMLKTSRPYHITEDPDPDKEPVIDDICILEDKANDHFTDAAIRQYNDSEGLVAFRLQTVEGWAVNQKYIVYNFEILRRSMEQFGEAIVTGSVMFDLREVADFDLYISGG